jgi:hypothetical protein
VDGRQDSTGQVDERAHIPAENDIAIDALDLEQSSRQNIARGGPKQRKFCAAVAEGSFSPHLALRSEGHV